MTNSPSAESKQALEMNRALAEGYYGIALPGLKARQGEINTALAGGESPLLSSAFQGQRVNLTEGLTGQADTSRRMQLAGSKRAMSGGNVSAELSTSDIGAQLANALYGSKFQEGQADINQKMNLMSMALGGAGTTGNAALTAAGQQLGAINYMPNYNQTLANVSGAAAGAGSIWGAYQQWAANQAGLQPGMSAPTGTNYPSTVVGNP